jgi:hypothetical protein
MFFGFGRQSVARENSASRVVISKRFRASRMVDFATPNSAAIPLGRKTMSGYFRQTPHFASGIPSQNLFPIERENVFAELLLIRDTKETYSLLI